MGPQEQGERTKLADLVPTSTVICMLQINHKRKEGSHYNFYKNIIQMDQKRDKWNIQFTDNFLVVNTNSTYERNHN